MTENTRPLRDFFQSLPSGNPARLVGTDLTTVFVQNLGKIHTIIPGAGVAVDSSDVKNPIVLLDEVTLGSLGLADTSLQPGTVTVADIDATGTPGDATFLRGDGVWSPAGAVGGVVDSVVEGAGIDVDSDDSANPIVSLNSSSVASLSLADSAIQPSDLAAVAFSGAYSDLGGTPNHADYATAAQGAKADTALQPDSSFITNMKDELYWIAVSS